MTPGLQVISLTVVLVGAVVTIVVLGLKAAGYVVKGIFKNEKVKG